MPVLSSGVVQFTLLHTERERKREREMWLAAWLVR